MNLFRTFVLLLSVAALAGCSTSYTIDTDYDQHYSFDNKKRFAIKMPPQPPGLPQDLVYQRIDNSIARSLSDRGYQRVEKDQADLLVSFFFVTEDKQEIINNPEYWGYYGHYWNYYHLGMNYGYIRDYTEGTLIIDIIDPATRTIKWRGATSSRLHHRTAEQKDQLFNEMVNAILIKFPPVEI